MEEGSPSFPEASLQTLTSSWCSLLRESFQFFSSLNRHIEHFLKTIPSSHVQFSHMEKNRHALSIKKNEVSSFHMARSARSALKTQKKNQSWWLLFELVSFFCQLFLQKMIILDYSRILSIFPKRLGITSSKLAKVSRDPEILLLMLQKFGCIKPLLLSFCWTWVQLLGGSWHLVSG